MYSEVGPCEGIECTDEVAYLVDRPTVGYRGVNSYYPNRVCRKGDKFVLMHVNPLFIHPYVYILPKYIFIFMGSFACLYDRGG